VGPPHRQDGARRSPIPLPQSTTEVLPVQPPLALVVDDAITDRTLLASLSRRRGFAVVEVADGRSALECARRMSPDLILLDIGLPDINGLTVLADLREEMPLLPVVIVSSSDDAAHVQDALDLGAVNYVKKPLAAEEFRFVLDRIFRALREESDLREVLSQIVERRTVMSCPVRTGGLSQVVTYLGRELRNHYPGYVLPLADIKLALFEALANATEHGNLEITYEEKTAAMATPGGMETLMTERLADPQRAKRRVEITAVYHPDAVEYRVRDQGPGFDPGRYEVARALADTTALHGRGLALIRHYMDEVSWNPEGNEIRMQRKVTLPRP
jgi:DNA-binding response OmpR family regulator